MVSGPRRLGQQLDQAATAGRVALVGRSEPGADGVVELLRDDGSRAMPAGYPGVGITGRSGVAAVARPAGAARAGGADSGSRRGRATHDSTRSPSVVVARGDRASQGGNGVRIETASALDDANWTSLVYGVEQGACTLMLGPNAVTGTLDGEHLPVHVAMARFVIDQLGPAGAHLDALPAVGGRPGRGRRGGRPHAAGVGAGVPERFSVDTTCCSDLAVDAVPARDQHVARARPCSRCSGEPSRARSATSTTARRRRGRMYPTRPSTRRSSTSSTARSNGRRRSSSARATGSTSSRRHLRPTRSPVEDQERPRATRSGRSSSSASSSTSGSCSCCCTSSAGTRHRAYKSFALERAGEEPRRATPRTSTSGPEDPLRVAERSPTSSPSCARGSVASSPPGTRSARRSWPSPTCRRWLPTRRSCSSATPARTARVAERVSRRPRGERDRHLARPAGARRRRRVERADPATRSARTSTTSWCCRAPACWPRRAAT